MVNLPGEPLPSGFDWRPAGSVELSPEARARVLAKIDAVDDARRRAGAASRISVVG